MQPTIILVHGAYAESSSWNQIVETLSSASHPVIAYANPLRTIAGDAAGLTELVRTIDGPVLLVGHSYGGATITGAGMDDRVVGLVYIAAVAPDTGETVQDQLNKYPSDIFSRVEVADNLAWMLPSGTEFFAGDLPEDEQKLVWATHFPPNVDLFNEQKLTADQVAWRSKPSWYVLATEDHTVHPDLQRWVSNRMGAKVTEVASSHVPMLSQPDVVIGVIREAAAVVQNG